MFIFIVGTRSYNQTIQQNLQHHICLAPKDPLLPSWPAVWNICDNNNTCTHCTQSSQDTQDRFLHQAHAYRTICLHVLYLCHKYHYIYLNYYSVCLPVTLRSMSQPMIIASDPCKGVYSTPTFNAEPLHILYIVTCQLQRSTHILKTILLNAQ